MKIVVIGGTGLIGSKVVNRLASRATRRWRQRRTRASTPSPAKDSTRPSKAPRWSSTCRTPPRSTTRRAGVLRDRLRNLLAAEAAAGVGHHVALSVVGSERLTESGYFRAKIAQEKLIKASSIPYSIVRATQFFEFVKSIADTATDGNMVHLPPVLIQPMAADDVANAVGRVAMDPPVNGTVEVAGPEQFRLDELIRREPERAPRSARGGHRLPRALLRHEVGERSLLPPATAHSCSRPASRTGWPSSRLRSSRDA